MSKSFDAHYAFDFCCHLFLGSMKEATLMEQLEISAASKLTECTRQSMIQISMHLYSSRYEQYLDPYTISKQRMLETLSYAQSLDAFVRCIASHECSISRSDRSALPSSMDLIFHERLPSVLNLAC